MEMSHWENWITKEQYILHIVFNIMYFFYQLFMKCFIFCFRQTEKVNHYEYKYTFQDQDHIWWISKFYKIYITKKLNFWLWNFLHSAHNIPQTATQKAMYTCIQKGTQQYS